MHRVGALVPLGLGLLWVYYALTSFSFGSLRDPGPALWPTVVGVFLVAMSVVLLFTERGNDEYEPFTDRSMLVALGAGGTAAFIVLYELVGFMLAAALFITYWCRRLGHEGWRLSLSVAVSVAIVFYAVFGYLLGVPLPTGLII